MEPAPQRCIFLSSSRDANPLTDGLKIIFDPVVPDMAPPGSGTVITDLANLNEEECCSLFHDGLEPVIFLDIVVRMAEPDGVERHVRIRPTWGASHFKGQLGHKIAQKYVQFWKDERNDEALLERVFLLELRQMDDGTWDAVVGGCSNLLWT